MSGKYALIIGNTEYTDPGLAQLSAPGKDAEDFARVLQDQGICAFDEVNLILNQPEYVVRGVIDEFFDQKKPDDLLVLYFSGHGVRDELGALHLAVRNTIRTRLRSTAIKSDYIREAMDQSRSKRQVLILDCCNSGAFAQGTKAATGVSIGTASAFEAGYGRIVLTASDSTQFAWEGNKVIGETDNSLFTHFLVEGLKGEADVDGDGRITVDELYDYAYERVKLATPKQTPSKFSSKQQGEIILRQNIRIEDARPVPLPDDLTVAVNSSLPYVREGAVRQLEGLLSGRNLGLARSARLALEKIAAEDDSRRVSQLATQVLEPVLQEERDLEKERKVSQESERIATQEAEAEGKAKKESDIFTPEKAARESFATDAIQQATTDKVAREEFSNLETGKTLAPGNVSQLLPWFTLGWGIAGALGGFIYNGFGEIAGGGIGGGIGGLVTLTALRPERIISHQKKVIWSALAWAIGGTIGWTIGWWLLSEAIGAGIGMAIFAMIGLVSTLGMDYIRSNWKSIAVITLGWAIGGGIAWSIAKWLIDDLSVVDYAAGWTIGMAIGWAIGGFVMGWQIMKREM